jgi:hypothetical protein
MTRGAPVAILTGAGTGISRASALALASRGYRLVLVGRRAEVLAATKARCEAVGADDAAIDAMFAVNVVGPLRLQQLLGFQVFDDITGRLEGRSPLDYIRAQGN